MTILIGLSDGMKRGSGGPESKLNDPGTCDFECEGRTESEAALREARRFIEASPGFGGLEVRRSLETPNRYVLLAKWRAVEDHTVGFRGSPQYQEWRGWLHHFYDPFPTVEHYQEPIA